MSSPAEAESDALPYYETPLICPACAREASQRVLRARQVLVLPVPGRPFERAFGWAEDHPRRGDSPLCYGVCVCPSCRYTGMEADFRARTGGAAPASEHVNHRTLHRLFEEEFVGAKPPLSALLRGTAGLTEEPERTIRITLAAIATEMLPYPELWRRREIGRLTLHLAWIYLDEAHLDWSGCKPNDPPVWHRAGPNLGRLQEALARLEPLREIWPEIPLDEERARAQALEYYQEAYERRSSPPGPEDAVLEERQLFELFGLNGKREQASVMLGRALATAMRQRAEQLRRLQGGEQQPFPSLAERRALTASVKRLTRLAEEIAQQRREHFPTKEAATRASRTPGAGSAATAHSRATRRPAPPARKRFRLFG